MGITRLMVLGLGAGLIAVVLAFPPFMVIDLESEGTRHTALGHYPVWSPPSLQDADEALKSEFGPSPTGDLSSLDLPTNTVHRVFEFVLTVIVASVMLLALGKSARGSGRERTDDRIA